MSSYGKLGMAHSIQGQLLRQSERREVAIFLHDGALWVADFVDGQGQLIDATTWFRFNCGALSTSHARRRMVLESAVPLSAALVAKIERLPRPAAMQQSSAPAHLFKALFTRLALSRLAAMVAGRFSRRHLHQFDSAAK